MDTFLEPSIGAAAAPSPGRRVGIFYALATALSLAGWIPYGAQEAGILHWNIPPQIPVIAQYSPAIAALIMVAFERRLFAFLRRSLNLRVGLRWYVVAALTPIALGASLIALHVLQGKPVPGLGALAGWPQHVARFITADPGTGGAFAGIAQMALAGPLQATLVLFAIAFANGGVSEEAGWRGYAFPELFAGRRALTAALLVGMLWGVWHTGPNFWAGIFEGRWNVLAIPLEYFLGTVPLNVMICGVFLNAKRSLVPGALFHASYNTTFFFLTALWTPGHAVVSLPEWLAATYAAMTLAIVIGRKTYFARG